MRASASNHRGSEKGPDRRCGRYKQHPHARRPVSLESKLAYLGPAPPQRLPPPADGVREPAEGIQAPKPQRFVLQRDDGLRSTRVALLMRVRVAKVAKVRGEEPSGKSNRQGDARVATWRPALPFSWFSMRGVGCS